MSLIQAIQKEKSVSVWFYSKCMYGTIQYINYTYNYYTSSFSYAHIVAQKKYITPSKKKKIPHMGDTESLD